MEEKYEVMCNIKDNSANAVIITNEKEGKYQIKFVTEGYDASAEGENFFYALIKLNHSQVSRHNY